MEGSSQSPLRRSARLRKRTKQTGLQENSRALKKRKTGDMHAVRTSSDRMVRIGALVPGAGNGRQIGFMKENCDRMQSTASVVRLQPLASKENLMNSSKRVPHSVAYTPPHSATPLPKLSWTNSLELWRSMRAKDRVKIAPESDLRQRHPTILSNMRTILLDWMMEVCEEYRLHRETYYLSLDMYDRFMDTQTDVHKEQLQLIGVTCLFISSKIEEIYPPKVTEFAYVTDGACSVSDIVEMELLICKALDWKLHHVIVTPNTWINTYMQLSSQYLRPPDLKAKEFEYPAYSSLEFIRVMQLSDIGDVNVTNVFPQLLDICTLDISHRQFSSSVLAASALYLMSEKARPNLHIMTGLEYSDVHSCVSWMQPFAVVLNQKGPVVQKMFKGVIPQDSHNIQTHEVSIIMLEDAIELRKRQEIVLPPYLLPPDCSVLLTPPRQERRRLAPMNVC